MSILMIRHTRPRIAPGTCYGQTDLDVDDTFELEARSVLANCPPAARIVSSPLQRCFKLGAYIGEALSLNVETDSRLQEMDFHRWEGARWSDIPRTELDEWAANFFHARPHGGESVAQLKMRVDAAIDHLEQNQGTTIVITHAGVIRAALANGETASDFQTKTDFGGIVRLPTTQEGLK